MPTINQLTAVDVVVPSDSVPIYSSANGDARKASMTALLAFFSGQIATIDGMVTQYAVVTASGFNTQIINGAVSIFLILMPSAVFASGSVTLPTSTSAVDRQEVIVSCAQPVTAFTVNGNGASVVGVPTTITAGGFFRLRFDAVTSTWYRVG